MSRRANLSDEQLLDLLRDKKRSLGRLPSYHEVAWDRRMPHPGLYKRRFGSWQGALEAAGCGVAEEANLKHERRRHVTPNFTNDRRRGERRKSPWKS